MVSTLARAMLAACAFFIAPGAAQAQDAIDGYKPPSAASRSAQAAQRQQALPGQKAQTAGTQKTIGLISTVGDTFTVKRVGVTVFGNEEDKFPVPAWKINDRIASSTTALLKKNFRVKRIPVPPGAFAPLDAPGGLFRDREEEFRQIVRNVAGAEKADFYLVVGPGGSRFGDSNQVLAGLGVVRTESLFIKRDIVHGLIGFTVFDPQFKKLRSEAASIGQDTFLVAVRGPHVILDDEKRLPPDAKAAVNDQRARTITTELVDKSVAMTLPKLFARD
jgi:hypothetical protein